MSSNNEAGKKTSCNIKVEIQCKKWIKPATPTPFHLQKYKLSFIDQLMSPILVQPIFYFSRETEEVETTPAGRLLDHLEESLSKVLTLYYPLAGRILYDEDDSLVSCQDQGVAFVTAKVDGKLHEFVDGQYDAKLLFSGLETLQTSNPLVLVQVNIFTCGGLAIGLGVSHKVADMFTISSFMNAWATTCRLETSLDSVVPPSFSFSSLLPASRSDLIHYPKPLRSTVATPPKYVMKRFVFTGEAIAKIRSSITEPYTRVQLVMALITRSLTNIEQARPKPLVISQSMNLRSRTGLLIEDNSFGNLFTLLITSCGKLDKSWELLAKLIKNSVKNVADEMSKVRDCSELSEKVVKASMEFQQVRKKGDSVNLVIFTSWCRFSLYEVDFGWGRPTLVTTVPILASNCVYLMDYKSDIAAGIEALVCLKEQDMALFQQQSDILEYTFFV